MTGLSIYVIVVDTPEGAKRYLALTSPWTAFSMGLIPEAIVGLLERPEEPIAPGNFTANAAFRRFLADFIARTAPDPHDNGTANSSSSISALQRREAPSRPRTSSEYST